MAVTENLKHDANSTSNQNMQICWKISSSTKTFLMTVYKCCTSLQFLTFDHMNDATIKDNNINYNN